MPLEPRMLLASPPSGNPGGPYAVAERGTISLAGSGNNSVIRYEWDFDYSASTGFQIDATGATPTLSAASLDGPRTLTIALRVWDDRNRSDLSTTTVAVANAAPSATFFAWPPSFAGSAMTVSLKNAIDSPADLAAGLRYAFDFDDNGIFEFNNGTSPTAAVPASLAQRAGTHVVRARVADKDGASSTYTGTLQVLPPEVLVTNWTVHEGAIEYLQTVAAGNGLSFAWDLDYDGVTFNVDATGVGVNFDARLLDGPTTRTIGVRATDAFGNSTTVPNVVRVLNVAPSLYLSGPANANEGDEVFIYSTATDPLLQDAVAMVRQFDFDNDGTFDYSLDSGWGAYIPIPIALTDGPRAVNVRVRVTDDEGAYDEKTHVVQFANRAPFATVGVDNTDVGVTTTIRVVTATDSVPADVASLQFAYDFDADGVFDTPYLVDRSTSIPAGYLQTPGTRSAHVVVRDKDGDTSLAAASFYVSPGLTAGIERSSPTIAIDEGGGRTIAGQYTVSTFTSVASIEWDLDYDRLAFDVDATGTSTLYSAGNGPSIKQIAFRVTDAQGRQAIATRSIDIRNVAPLATPLLVPAVFEGSSVPTTIGLASVVDPFDAVESLRFDFDFDADGTFDLIDRASPTATLPANLLADGPAVVTSRVRVRDPDGGASEYGSQVTVYDAPPFITLTGEGIAKVGNHYVLQIDTFEAGADTINSAFVQWGDGVTTQLAAGQRELTHVYSGAQRNVTITVIVNDEDGTYSRNKTVLVDAPPLVLRPAFAPDSIQFSVPSARGPRISMAFTESIGMSLVSTDLIVRNLATDEVISTVSGANGLVFTGVENQSIAWRWPRGLPDGNYRATLPAGSVFDTMGNVNPLDTHIDFFVLAGDATRDRTVNFDDLLRLASNYNIAGRVLTQGDFNYDGSVNFDDLLILAARYSVALPAPTSSLSVPAPGGANGDEADDGDDDSLGVLL